MQNMMMFADTSSVSEGQRWFRISAVLQNSNVNATDSIISMEVWSPSKKYSFFEVLNESQLDLESSDITLPCQWPILQMQSILNPNPVLPHILMHTCVQKLQQHKLQHTLLLLTVLGTVCFCQKTEGRSAPF